MARLPRDYVSAEAVILYCVSWQSACEVFLESASQEK